MFSLDNAANVEGYLVYFLDIPVYVCKQRFLYIKRKGIV